MKLKAFVASLDEVDAKYHDLYVEDGDGFKLDVEGITAHPEVTALANAHNRTKATLRTRTEERDAAQALADALPEDFDAELYQRAVTEGVGGGGKIQNEAEIRREASEAGKAAARKELGKDIDKLTGERDRLKARVERDERNTTLDAALDAVKVTDPIYRRAAKALLSGSLKVMAGENDGEFEVLAQDPQLGDIPVADFVKAWSGTDEGKAFIGARQNEGSGANGNRDDGNPVDTSTKNPWKKDSLNFTEQARLRRENPTLAAKFAKEAGASIPS